MRNLIAADQPSTPPDKPEPPPRPEDIPPKPGRLPEEPMAPPPPPPQFAPPEPLAPPTWGVDLMTRAGDAANLECGDSSPLFGKVTVREA